MIVRIAAPVILCFALVALGCSSQPSAPSTAAAAAVSSTAASSSSGHATASRFDGRTPGVIYVTSQQLYYDTFVVKDPLPMEGPFQLLVNGRTEFGPGESGYLGGRWWEDVNGNGVQDSGDHFFLCPLLPPGRPRP
jgi:hypothetical protein